ncbi:MAG: alpha/beta hydrolase [Phycisphaerae bacterium]
MQRQKFTRHQRGMCAVAILCLAFSAVSGCARVLMPTPNLYAYGTAHEWDRVPPELQTNTVDVVYATDRAPLDSKQRGKHYGLARSRSLAFGTCTVAIGKNLSWPDLVAASSKRRHGAIPLSIQQIDEIGRFPETPWEFNVVNGEPVADDEVIAQHERACRQVRELVAERLRSASRKDVYVYVHGFNNLFDDAAFIMAEFWHFSGREGVPLIYSWPAGGGAGFRSYNEDRESGEFTVFHLKQFLEALVETPGLEKIHVIAHSRGTEVLTSALRELNIKYRAMGRDPASTMKIGNLVLAAPDIDYDVATQRLSAERITRICERLTVYSSPRDRALAAANWLFRSALRLGTLTLREIPRDRRLALGKLRDVSFIRADVTSDFIGHSYFYKNPAVSSDLILLIRDDLDPGAENGRPLERDGGGFWTIRDNYLKYGPHAD